MSDSLSNAETIGGVAVAITGDLSKLRAANAEAKAVAGEIDELAPSVKIGYKFDDSAMRARVKEWQNLSMAVKLDVTEAGQKIRVLRQQASAPIQVASAPVAGPIRVIRNAASDPVASQLAPSPIRVTRAVAPNEAASATPQAAFDPTAVGTSKLFPTDAGAVVNGQGYEGGMAQVQAETTRSLKTMANSTTKAAKGMDAFFAESNNAMKSLGRIAKVVAVAEIAAQVGQAGVHAYRAYNAGSPQENQKEIAAARGNIQGLPVLGGAIDAYGNKVGRGYNAARNLFKGVTGQGGKNGRALGFESDDSYADRILAEESERSKNLDVQGAAADKRNRSVRQINETSGESARQIGLRLRAVGTSPEGEKVMKMESDMKEWEKQNRQKIVDAGGNELDSVKEERKARQAEIAQAKREAEAARTQNDANNWDDVRKINGGRAEGNLRAAGKSTEAGRLAIDNQYGLQASEMQAQLDADMASGKGDKNNIAAKIKALKLAADDALKNYDQQIEEQRQAVISESKSTIKVIGLRAAGKVGEANEEAINQSYAERIKAADKNGDKETATQLGAERDAKIQEDRRQRAKSDQQSIEGADVAANAAKLRMAHQYYAAESAVIAESNKQRIQQMKDSGSSQKAIDAEEGRQKAEGEMRAAQHKEDIDRKTTALGTRQEIAKAQGDGNSGLASAIGNIANMKAELKDADPDLRGKIATTQKAELIAMQKQMTAGNNVYAEAGDRNRMAFGGPSGDAAAKQQATLDAIAAYLSQINDTTKTGSGLGA